MSITVTAGKVAAFRLAAHGLAERAVADAMPAAAGRCGIQNSPPGSALLALHARVQGVTAERFERAVAEGKTLLQTWSMRGAPFYFPTDDAPIFTAGVLPTTEAARRRLVQGVGPALDQLAMSLDDVVGLLHAEVGAVLPGRRVAIGPLGAELSTRVARRLPPDRREAWDAEGPYAAGQPLGEAIVHFALRILALEGIVCLTPRADNTAPFALVEEWLGRPLVAAEPDHPPAAQLRAELLRRYLRCYGPSTRAHFAAWLGVRAGDVAPWWDQLVGELTPVGTRRKSWLLTADLDALRSAQLPAGVRLLPPRDPYTQMRDRDVIVDKALHRRVWRTVGEPGTILVDGQIAGTWRPRKRGRLLTITVTAFAPLSQRHRADLEVEAAAVGRLRGADEAALEFDAL